MLVLVRPEILQLEAALNGGAPGANVLSGTVLSQTFLGAVTRVKVTTPAATLISDMSAARAEALPVGARVTARVPSDETRLINLPDEGANVLSARSGKSLKTPPTPSSASSSMRSGLFTV